MRLRSALSSSAVTALVAGVLTATSLLVAAPAGAATGPACGDVLTVDSVLRADLECEDDALRLAPGVDLDLGGHTIEATGQFGTAIWVASAGDTQIRRGAVRGFATGVAIYGVDGRPGGSLRIDRVRFASNIDGVDASGQPGTGAYGKPTTVTRSVFVDNGRTGINAVQGRPLTVERSVFTANQTGVFVGDGQAAVTASHFERNDAALALTQTRGTVERSTFVDNPRAVVTRREASLTVTGSTFVGSDVAVDAEAAEAAVSRSRFLANATAVVVGGAGGSVTDSTFRWNGTTIRLAETPWAPTLIRGNTFTRNGHGLWLEEADASVSIGDNEARRNEGWGIRAPGATDLGGDVAQGNGNDPQCVGVSCARR
ncbi:right-handed parallel beta-helix repeat-containing protein [Cellulomonas edaphi]|uniref:Right-handed parallel beta-helix repeat-containing protein n=1 Tax=Cellulomonas edaphi TaxID=3053468 RepID=A0ABT7S8R4_9CELL|nr:right-handed parallel beta-helix repeat-containing protein [Cellulomons edaphi]MDM7832007.1 right-handed parallel beta-helix repeat-containing protein [Cellulomons edaphi]